MTKHILMLSAATAALLAAPAFAAGPTTITTTVTTAQSTSTTGDLTISSTGAVQVNTANAPVVTMNSSNFVENDGTIANQGTTGAIGIFVNATTNPVVPTTGVTNTGTIVLSGTGVAKIGIQVAGVGGVYTGNVNLSGTSNIQITGDGSVGVLNDLGMTTKGNFNLAGNISITASDPNTTSVASLSSLVKQWGTLQGNLDIAQGSIFTAIGQGNFGVSILGDIQNCDPAVAACAANPAFGKGLFFNGGTVSVFGSLIPSGSVLNPEGGYALGIGGGIAEGVMNSGPINTSSGTPVASLFGSGLSVYPTVVIDPILLTGTARTLEIGVYTTDTINPGYSFYNRGSIQSSPIDANFSTTAMAIAGSGVGQLTSLAPTAAQLTADPTLAGKGGIFNSGVISASTSSSSSARAAVVDATALSLEDYSFVPRITVSGETRTTNNPTLGQIVASISGPMGGIAKAITISTKAVMPELDIVSHGSVSATATTTDTTISSLQAFAVQDTSNTLKTINNAGNISTSVTGLTNGLQVSRAIDLSLSTADNIVINNSGTIVGDILMGQSGNNHRIFVGNVGVVGTTGFAAGDGTKNSATNVTNAPIGTATVNGPASIIGNIDFGIGGNSSAPSILHIGGSASVVGKIFSRGAGVLDVQVDGNGRLVVGNTQTDGPLRTRDLRIFGGELDLSVSQGTLGTNPVITASGVATIASGSNVGLSFGSFISSPNPNAPVSQTLTLIDAIGSSQILVTDPQIAAFNAALRSKIPFLFQEHDISSANILSLSPDRHELRLTLTPKAPGAGGLGLTGNALTMFPYANAALTNDTELGAALINSITSNSTAQATYAQFAPDVSGGMRELAISLTDQATGQVAARQRTLRQFADQSGELTLWGNEFAQSFNLKGVTGSATTAYKDRGFGFVLGMDGGSKQDGWYGAAFTFYTGDVAGVAPLTSKTNTEWYMLTGYTDWKGRHLFFDTQATVGFGNLLGRRFLTLSSITRTAESKRTSMMGALGATMGATLKYAGINVVPHISLDGMTLREEKYTETGGGNGFDLAVGSYYATSLRTFVGSDFYRDINLGLFSLRPEARFGYRFDFLNNPVKLDTQFVSTIGSSGTFSGPFTLTGPNTGRGDLLAGFSLGASSETWSLGLNYDWVRGAHGSTTQVGTLSLLGRI